MGTSDGIESPPPDCAGSGGGVPGMASGGAPELAATSAGFLPRVSFCEVDAGPAPPGSGFGEGPEEHAATSATAIDRFRMCSISGLSICLLALGGVRADPVEYRMVPELAVAGLQHPVPLVREVEQPRFDTLALQRREHSQPLLDGNAEVELALHHQGRGVEVLRVRARAPLPVG